MIELHDADMIQKRTLQHLAAGAPLFYYGLRGCLMKILDYFFGCWDKLCLEGK